MYLDVRGGGRRLWTVRTSRYCKWLAAAFKPNLGSLVAGEASGSRRVFYSSYASMQGGVGWGHLNLVCGRNPGMLLLTWIRKEALDFTW